MELSLFTLANLNDLDGGKAALAFETHVKRAALDCLDRPADTKPRKVQLEVQIVPLIEPGGDCTEVEVKILAKSTVPPHTTRAYSLGLRRNGSLVFNADSPDAIDQTTMPFRKDD